MDFEGIIDALVRLKSEKQEFTKIKNFPLRLVHFLFRIPRLLIVGYGYRSSIYTRILLLMNSCDRDFWRIVRTFAVLELLLWF